MDSAQDFLLKDIDMDNSIYTFTDPWLNVNMSVIDEQSNKHALI